MRVGANRFDVPPPNIEVTLPELLHPALNAHHTKNMNKRKLLKPILLATTTLLATAILIALWSTDWTAALGSTPGGPRLDRIRSSPQWSGEEEIFVNAEPTTVMLPGKTGEVILDSLSKPDDSVPSRTLPVARPSFDVPPAGGLRLTWLGHSTTVVEIDDVRILLDPVFSERTSPSTLVGPARFHPLPIEPGALPAIDAVVISHDHYDHLDMRAVRELTASTEAVFLVPLGVGAHLERWGVPAERIRELDWWDETQIGEVTVAATPARHFSGRGVLDRFSTLWASWTLIGPRHRVFFSGDTGPFGGFKDISDKYGPFDIAMIEIGAADPNWPQIHMGPEAAVEAFETMDAHLLVPIHWSTFDLGMHGWTEPIRAFVTAAEKGGVRWAAPMPGGAIEPGVREPREPWWKFSEK